MTDNQIAKFIFIEIDEYEHFYGEEIPVRRLGGNLRAAGIDHRGVLMDLIWSGKLNWKERTIVRT